MVDWSTLYLHTRFLSSLLPLYPLISPFVTTLCLCPFVLGLVFVFVLILVIDESSWSWSWSYLISSHLILSHLISSEIPYVVSKGMYNTVTLMGTLSFALSLLAAVFVATQMFTFRYVQHNTIQH